MNRSTLLAPLAVLALLAGASTCRAQGTKRAVVVGVRKYEYTKQFRNLNYTLNDAAKVAIIFASQKYEVTLLLDENAFDPKPAEIALGLHKYRDELNALKRNPLVKIGVPDKKSIAEAITAACKASQEGDTLVVYLAGHGVMFDDNPKLTSPFFCPTNATLGKSFPMGKPALDPDVVKETMIEIDGEVLGPMAQKTTVKAVLLVDACQNDPKEATARGVNAATAPKVAGVYAFYSCSEGQKSHESNEKGHGLFTLALLDCFNGNLKTGQVKKGTEISTGELSAGLPYHVDRYARELEEFKGPKRIKQEPAQGGSGQGNTPVLVAALAVGIQERPPVRAGVLGVVETFVAKDGKNKERHRLDLPGGNKDQFQYFVKVGFPDGERYVGQHDVTQDLYPAVMGKNPSKNKGKELKFLPVEGVSPKDATDFCAALGKKVNNGFEFRLPTKEEMAFLIADGNPNGKCFIDSDVLRNHHAVICEESGGTDVPPISAICKGFGKDGLCRDPSPDLTLMHIVGNVSKWCTDGNGGFLRAGGCSNLTEEQFTKYLQGKPALESIDATDKLKPVAGTHHVGIRLIAVPKK